ncbi:MAG: tetratricopeptide repeat protein [Acidimicrobiia bacterium]|nr:tetratricopeptide repeat protein [Acidimicrobiia bacterium]
MAMALLLPIVFSTSVSAGAWSPRAAVLLVGAVFGLPRLVPLLWSDARRAALAGAAFLAVAALSTVLSPQPMLSLFGLYNWGTGLLFVAALVGVWALGASVGDGVVEVVERALIAGVLVNAAVAIVQGAVNLDTAPFTRYEGRAAGLLSNPVYLATLMAGGLALVLPRVRTSVARWGAATVVVAAALQLSGSRFALGLAIASGGVVLFRERRQAAAGVAALALGLLLGVGVGALGGATTGSGRVQAGGESVGTTARLHEWASAADAIGDRPVLGAGPGRFRAATSRYRDLALVRAEGADRRFVDAHDIVVEYATTTGVLGAAALACWLLLAWRRARGSLLGFALLVLAMHLVEPQSLGTTPLAFLALGVAGRAEVSRLGRAATAVTAVLVLAALASAGRLLWGDFVLHQAELDFAPDRAAAAVRTLPPWPEPSQVAGRVWLFRSIATRDPAARQAALRWDRLATRRDPTDPDSWAMLAEAELYFGQPQRAVRSFGQALRWDPWSVRALNGLGNALLAVGDRPRARAALERSLRAEPHQPKIRTQLSRF